MYSNFIANYYSKMVINWNNFKLEFTLYYFKDVNSIDLFTITFVIIRIIIITNLLLNFIKSLTILINEAIIFPQQ